MIYIIVISSMIIWSLLIAVSSHTSLIWWTSDVLALVNALPVHTTPLTSITVTIYPAVPICFHIPTLPIHARMAFQKCAYIQTLPIWASLPIIRALCTLAAFTLTTIVSQACLIFLTHKWCLMAGYIKIILHLRILTYLTFSGIWSSWAIGLDSTEFRIRCHDIVNDRACLVVGSWVPTCFGHKGYLCLTHLQGQLAHSVEAWTASWTLNFLAFILANALLAELVASAIIIRPTHAGIPYADALCTHETAWTCHIRTDVDASTLLADESIGASNVHALVLTHFVEAELIRLTCWVIHAIARHRYTHVLLADWSLWALHLITHRYGIA